jgi:flagellar biosynthesis/type III secretory pathway protein FliH
MSYLLWHRDRNVGFASSRLVLRAAEVPLFADAQALRDRLEQLTDAQAERVAAAAEEARVRGYVEGREQGTIDGRDEVAATIVELTRAATHKSCASCSGNFPRTAFLRRLPKPLRARCCRRRH